MVQFLDFDIKNKNKLSNKRHHMGGGGGKGVNARDLRPSDNQASSFVA